ncbi:MAG TPA: NADH-quinone oxidoreductase subunit K [Thermoanaerobaculaceae bacterium]|nr:NADH-quinone oxidoreductase subunit K [Thermoanaerobaculaceae bacterium]HRS16621.1 NADH-quinone oxidoreductase subunit K [Thermoanaerobaculaceae bacterium]
MPELDPRPYLVAGAALLALGLWGVAALPHVVRKILAVNLMGTGVFLVLVATAARTPGEVPDPVPHAMVLTGIVVSVCATALALALAQRLQESGGGLELDGRGKEAAGPAPAPDPECGEPSCRGGREGAS